MSNEDLFKRAEEAIDKLFSDQSVSAQKALENMEELASDIEVKIDALKEDIEREA